MKKIYKSILIAVIALSAGPFTASAQLTYKDVAGIFYSRCASCHHKDGGAPFAMMNYSQTYPNASAIQADLNSGKMPPWPPDTTFSRFIHERIITASEKTTIINWINAGAPKGDTTQAPLAPTYTKYKLTGTPDLVLRMPVFTSNAVTKDAYDCFLLPTGLNTDRIIRAYEIVPGNASIVHHVIINIDTLGTQTSDLSGDCFTPLGHLSLGIYVPGSVPTVFPGQAPLKMGVKLKAGSQIMMQIHYPAGSAGKVDSSQIRIYFYPPGTTGIRSVKLDSPLQNWDLSIQPNTVGTYTATFPAVIPQVIPSPLSLFSVFPHAHLIGKSMEVYAYDPANPANSTKLIRIKNWNFNWQGYYTYPKMIKVPAGYKLFSQHVYDNTATNPFNPSNPPQLVVDGVNTKDEMFLDFFQWVDYQPGDENIDIAALLANDPLLATSVMETQPMHIQSYAYPNPFNDHVKIGYELTGPAETAVSVYNIYGSEVKNLAYQYNSAGTYSVNWDGRNESGTKVPAGIYFYTIKTGNSMTSGKIVLMPK